MNDNKDEVMNYSYIFAKDIFEYNQRKGKKKYFDANLVYNTIYDRRLLLTDNFPHTMIKTIDDALKSKDPRELDKLEAWIDSSLDFNKLTDDELNYLFHKDEHGRFRSWEHNYKVFHNARELDKVDYDYLSLHLSFYLASWGMYRWSSFLLQKDYRIHIPIIKEVLNHKYDILFGIECSQYKNKNVINLLFELADYISNYYNEIRKEVKEEEVLQDVSETLVTKVLMGVLGCCPAYDRYFKDGLSREHIGIKKFNAKSILELVDLYEANFDKLEETRAKMNVEGWSYPQMKMLDMGFWKIGFDSDTSKGFKKSH